MEISVFDMIGPNMIGPSSSHTAGALKIARIASKLMKHQVQSVIFTLYGSFAQTYQGHGTDKALVAGILGFDTEDYRIRDSFDYAKQRGVQYAFLLDTSKNDMHPNTVKIELKDVKGNCTELLGESIGGGAVTIKKINGVDIALTGEYITLVVKHKDESGVLAHITGVLCKYNINIAFAKCYRENKGQLAYTIIEIDEHIALDVIREIEERNNIYSATLIEV